MTYLSKKTTYLERKVLGAAWADNFSSEEDVVRNHGELKGSVSIGPDGAIFPDSGAPHIDYEMWEPALFRAECGGFSLLLEFTPDFELNDGDFHALFDCGKFSGGERILVLVRDTGNLTITFGTAGGSLSIPTPNFSHLWESRARNVLGININNSLSRITLNEEEFFDTNLISCAAVSPTDPITIGAYNGGSFPFSGVIHRVVLFRSAVSSDAFIDYYNDGTFEKLPAPIVDLPMFSGDHVPGDRTLDRSGNGIDAVFSAPVPTKNVERGYTGSGTEYFTLLSNLSSYPELSLTAQVKNTALDVPRYVLTLMQSGGDMAVAVRITTTGEYQLVHSSGTLVISTGVFSRLNQVDVVTLLLDSSDNATLVLNGAQRSAEYALTIPNRDGDFLLFRDSNPLIGAVYQLRADYEVLTAVKVFKLYDEMRRFRPTDQANLCSETTPAERARGARWSSRFVNQLQVEALDGVANGTPVIDNGLYLKGDVYDDWVKFDLKPGQVGGGTGEFSSRCLFRPSWPKDTPGGHTWYGSPAGDGRTLIRKDTAGNISVYIADSFIGTVDYSVWSPHWKEYSLNCITVSSESGDTDVYLNDAVVMGGDSSAWTNPQWVPSLTVGALDGGISEWEGEIYELEFFDRRLTFEEHLNYCAQTTYGYLDDALAYWPMNDSEGPQLLDDPDMELASVALWMPAGTATKETVNPKEGKQWLKLAGISGNYVRQSKVTIGETYRLSGWARGDGVSGYLRIWCGSFFWIGTTSTAWQYFDIVFTAGFGDVFFYLTGGGYFGLDNCDLRQVSLVAQDVSKYQRDAVLGIEDEAPKRNTPYKGFIFDGVDDFMTAGDPGTFDTDEYTIFATFRVLENITSGERSLLDYRTVLAVRTGWSLAVTYDNRGLFYQYRGDSFNQFFYVADAYSIGRLVGFVVTRDANGTVRFYVDGKLIVTRPDFTIGYSGAEQLYIGKASFGLYHFNGIMYGAGVLPYSIDDTQVADLDIRLRYSIGNP